MSFITRCFSSLDGALKCRAKDWARAIMDREGSRAFAYHAALPYATETHESALCELDEIYQRIESLNRANKFQEYEFGTNYAPEVTLATKALTNWVKRKLDIPLRMKLQITRIYLNESLQAIEPTLFVRYGTLVLNLWASSDGQREIRQYFNKCDEFEGIKFDDLVNMIRNVVILGESRSAESLVKHPNRLSGLGGSAGSQKGPKKQLSPIEVALMLAKQFSPCFRVTQGVVDRLNNDVLAYLGAQEHTPSQAVVLSAYCSLIPYSDPQAFGIFVPFLFSLWRNVPIDVANRHIQPSIAEFAVYNRLGYYKGDHDFSEYELDLCFQSNLHSMQIPLISAQKASKSSKRGKGAANSSNSSGTTSRLSMRGTKNRTTQPGSDTYSFAKLLVWTLSPTDSRSLRLLEHFANAVLSFCHPSNIGTWTSLILNCLNEVVTAYTRRLNIERNELRDVLKESEKLTPELTRKLVYVVMQPVMMSVYSSASIIFMQAIGMVRTLAWLCPELIVNEVLSMVYPTLQHGLHQPQRLSASIACLDKLAVPLTSQPHYKMHLTTLLELTIPNLDTNDTKRCIMSMSLFQTVASLCKFEDTSDGVSQAVATQILPVCVRAIEEGQDINISEEEAEMVTRGTSAAFPELLSVYLRRIFELLEASPEPQLGSAASASLLKVLLACSNSIFNRLLEITLTEISNPQQLSFDAFAQVTGAFVRANGSEAFPKLWKLLNANIREEIFENQAGQKRVAMPKDNSFLRYLSVLNMCLLAANPILLLDIKEELSDLLQLLREKTGPSVVYTVANTIHHAIATLVNYNVLLPSPLGDYKNNSLSIDSQNVLEVPYKNLRWSAPSAESYALAEKLYIEHFMISKTNIYRSIATASSNIHDGDAVSSALIFIRTITGGIAPMTTTNHYPKVLDVRQETVELLLDIYPKISRDDTSSLKEVLFVAKVWLCDEGYERTARLESHQNSLYVFEKNRFEIPGYHKEGLPPSVIARRAQLYHHQRLSLATQHRACDARSRKLVLDVLMDASFSPYPAVTRNAFSALYSSLKIFNDSELYLQVYELVLDQSDRLLDEKEYEKAEGGFSLFKYHSFGLQTVGKSPKHLIKFVQLCIRGATADHRQLITLATQAFFFLLPDVFRVGITDSVESSECWQHIQKLIDFLSSGPLEVQHWRVALLRTSALLMVTLCPQLPLNENTMELLLNGLLVQHPDVRLTAVLACINILQSAFWRGLVGFDSSYYRVSGTTELPFNAIQTKDETLLENDLPMFIKRSPLPVVRSLKSQPRPRPNLQKFAAQATEPKDGLWRLAKCSGNTPLPRLGESNKLILERVLSPANTKKFWSVFVETRRLEPRSEEDRLNKASALLFRDLISLSCLGFGIDADQVVGKILESVDYNDKNWHRVAAESLCGILMAFPIGDQEKLSLIVDKLFNDEVIAAISSENVGYWTSALAFALPKVDHRRLGKIIDKIEAVSRPDTSTDGGGIKLSLRTSLHTELMDAIGPRMNSLESVVGSWECWNHSLQTTRETAVEEVATAVGTTLKWPRIELNLNSGKRNEVNEVQLDAKTISFIQSLFEYKSEKSDTSLLGLILSLLYTIDGDAWVDVLISHAFPLLLRLSAVRDDPEILDLVTQVFSELSITVFSGKSLSKIVTLIIENVKSEQWHQRMRILLFTQSFFFNHLLMLSEIQRRELTYLVVDALADQQAEVRELAADTLSGIVRCSSPDEQNEYVELLNKRFMRSIGRKTPMLQRHAAVLGLGALIVAFPYASPPPPWIPAVLAAIASKVAGDSDIVGKSAKQVLSDFKKTRQDTWHIDQLAFSQDQLDDLDGVLWRNYFA